jgi:hypothetical protein
VKRNKLTSTNETSATMNTEIKNNSTENNLLRCLFSLRGRTFYSSLNRDNNAKNGKVLRLSVDKMCRNLAAVGNATTTKERKTKKKPPPPK